MGLAEKILAFILFLALCAGGGFLSGYRAAANKFAAQQLEAERVVNAKFRAEVQRGNTLAAELESIRSKTRTVTRTITREVNNYVTPLASSACAVPIGFVQLHDAAAQNRMPEPAGLDADAAGGVDLAAVAETVSENYGTCHEWRDQLDALIDWHVGAGSSANGQPYPQGACPPDSRHCAAEPAP